MSVQQSDQPEDESAAVDASGDCGEGGRKAGPWPVFLRQAKQLEGKDDGEGAGRCAGADGKDDQVAGNPFEYLLHRASISQKFSCSQSAIFSLEATVKWGQKN